MLKTAPRRDPAQELLLPGEPELIARREREANDIPMPEATWKSLCDMAEGLGVSLPEPGWGCLQTVTSSGLSGHFPRQCSGIAHHSARARSPHIIIRIIDISENYAYCIINGFNGCHTGR